MFSHDRHLEVELFLVVECVQTQSLLDKDEWPVYIPKALLPCSTLLYNLKSS